MEISSLSHLLGEVQNATEGKKIILFGSSSLLASFPADDPHLIGVAETQDADFFLEPDDEELRHELERKFGEDKAFHRETGYCGDFVDLRLSESFPEGWRDRLVATEEISAGTAA